MSRKESELLGEQTEGVKRYCGATIGYFGAQESLEVEFAPLGLGKNLRCGKSQLGIENAAACWSHVEHPYQPPDLSCFWLYFLPKIIIYPMWKF